MVTKDSVEFDQQLRTALQMVAPGTALRDGLERILRGKTGGLIVLGFDRQIEQISGGGFVLDVDFSATRLRELAKMDGAIILDIAPPTASLSRPGCQWSRSPSR